MICSATTNDTIPNTEKTSQKSTTVKGKIDHILDIRDGRNKTNADTNYIKRISERLILKLRINASGSNLVSRGSNEYGNSHSTLEAQNKYTFSASASYRGLTLGAAINPSHLAGKNKDYGFNMNAYENRVGADIIFHAANTYKGFIETNQGRIDVPTGIVRQNMIYVNTYYIFNSRRFSYPAAFNQSWIQQRNCGSLMLGASFMGGYIRIRHDDKTEITASRLTIANVGIGVGYGYNLVLKHKWLIHLSTLPQIVVFSHNKMTTDGTRVKAPYKFPNIITVGRMAVVRHFDRWLAGFTTIINTSTTGDRDQLQISTIKWRARLFIGFKL